MDSTEPLLFKTIRKDFKKKLAQCWVESGPRLKAYWVRQPAVAADRHDVAAHRAAWPGRRGGPQCARVGVIVTPTFCKNKFFCANRSAYQIVVPMKNFPKK
jgi:hypothetical protein